MTPSPRELVCVCVCVLAGQRQAVFQMFQTEGIEDFVKSRLRQSVDSVSVCGEKLLSFRFVEVLRLLLLGQSFMGSRNAPSLAFLRPRKEAATFRVWDSINPGPVNQVPWRKVAFSSPDNVDCSDSLHKQKLRRGWQMVQTGGVPWHHWQPLHCSHGEFHYIEQRRILLSAFRDLDKSRRQLLS